MDGQELPRLRRDLTVEPVAICGMAMRLPGGIRTTQGFWDMLYNKRHGHCRVPDDRYNVDAWYGPGKSGQVNSKYGYFLQDVKLDQVDLSFWSMKKGEVEAIDPQQRLVLEVAYECLQNAGQKPSDLYGKPVAVYAGSYDGDWVELDNKDSQSVHPYRLTGYGDYMLANRVHYEFGFTGPSVTVRTACSSSLTGLYHAYYTLLAGDCTAALVIGANLIMSPKTTAAMQEQGITSPSGTCKTFDASADGYGRGEAINALYIKKLSDALRDGDPIRAVIRAIAINAGGKAASLGTPNSASHEVLLRRGHEIAGVTDLGKIAMIECHGTGTAVGDPIETIAIANVFGRSGCYIGSVKPNVGHSEGASGLTSVIKMVLALEHQTIPPNINFSTPNPKIPFAQGRLKVPLHPMSWPSDKEELVGVNCFGIGGSNAFVLLQSSGSLGLQVPETVDSDADQSARLLVFSAKHTKALQQMIADHQAYQRVHPSSLDNMSYSLASKRDALDHRAYAIATGFSWEIKISPQPGTASPQVVFVFSGQGSQYPRMAGDLITRVPEFRERIASLDNALKTCRDPPTWSLLEEILRPEASSRLSTAEMSQPCITAVQLALVDLLVSRGVLADAVVGHSSGEIAAAYACGALTAAEAIQVAYQRGRAVSQPTKSGAGGMIAVGLSRQEASAFLKPGVCIGCDNSPQSVTLTGDKPVLHDIAATIRKERPDTWTRVLRVDRAYHSHHMAAIKDHYWDLLPTTLHSRKPRIPFYSSVTGTAMDGEDDLGREYWVSNLVSPVEFSTAVANLIHSVAPPKLFVEIGPQTVLTTPVKQILQHHGDGGNCISSLTRTSDAYSCLLRMMGEIWLRRPTIDLALSVPAGRFLEDLPLYPWQYEESLWHESRLSREWRFRRHPHHDVLGSRILETTDDRPGWRNVLRLDSLPWIKEHEVSGDILLPGTCYVCMAGEAIRQLTGSQDYTARRVHIRNALSIPPGSEIEIVTQLERESLTSTRNSEWFNFTIASFSRESWVKHAFGQVRPGTENPRTFQPFPRLPRELTRQAWYHELRQQGISYGSRFRALRDMKAHPIQKVLVAGLEHDIRTDDSDYAIHPVTMDGWVQAIAAASRNGLMRRKQALSVPTYIDEVYVRSSKETMVLQATADDPPKSTISGNVVVVSGEEVVGEIKGLQLSKIGDDIDDDRTDDPCAAAELEWKKDVNLLDIASLVQPGNFIAGPDAALNELAVLCMIDALEAIRSAASPPGHRREYQDWLEHFIEEAACGTTDPGPDLCRLPPEARAKLNADLSTRLQQHEATESAAVAVRTVAKNLSGIVSGDIDGFNLLLEDNILNRIYDYPWATDYSELIELLAHRKPNMRILEIGSGASKVTATVLRILRSDYEEPMFSEYTYTAATPVRLKAAMESLTSYAGVDYRVLDMSCSVTEQGFAEGTFDLVVACSTLHETADLQQFLINVRRLLHPQGCLLMQEISPGAKWIDFVLSVLPEWWVGHNSRRREPHFGRTRWEEALTTAGFGGIEAAASDNYLMNTIVSRPAKVTNPDKHISVLHNGNQWEDLERIRYLLEPEGFTIDICTLETGPTGHDVLAILDLALPFLHELNEQSYSKLKTFVASLNGNGLLWLTGSCQIACNDPRYSMILGLSRVLRLELSLDFGVLELDTFDHPSLLTVVGVLNQFLDRVKQTETGMSPTLEWATVNGETFISRYHFVHVGTELNAPNAELPRKLEQRWPGMIDTLFWKTVDELSPGPDDVTVDIKAVGVNFKDVLVAAGIVLDKSAIGRGFGYEASGVVQSIGANVDSCKVGDRVVIGSSGLLATRVCADHRHCTVMPDTLSFEEGATMIAVYSTAIHSLIHAAKLESGESILIHAASGGLGIAALSLARMVGAEVYCTCSESKVEFLKQVFGIPGDRIFNSRDASFLPAIKAATGGRGVDVVLNSLSGPLLHASWQCVAEFGRFVEVGRSDLAGQGKLAMDPFEANRTFIGVDLVNISTRRPRTMQMLGATVMNYYREGHIKPITPLQSYDVTSVEDVFRRMQKASHVGKMVLKMPPDPSTLQADPPKWVLQLRPDRAYLLVGGLGGIGKAVSTWLVERGARHLVFLSRSAGSLQDDDLPLMQELRTVGCQTTRISGNVAEYSDVQRAIQSTSLPIGGVLQASMVLQDENFHDMDWQKWQSAVLPKVKGTWNLHNALLEQEEPLDHFLFLSSSAAACGQWGQANYCAANTFLDSFVQYRHSLGLPASVIDIGAVEDVGYLTNNPKVLNAIRSTGQHLLCEADLLCAMELMFRRSAPTNVTRMDPDDRQCHFVNHAHISTGMRSTLPISASANRTVWRKDPRMLVYHNLENPATAQQDVGDGNDAALRAMLKDATSHTSALTTPDTIVIVGKGIGQTLFRILRQAEFNLETDMDTPLADLGIDSLISVEMRNWLRRTVGVEMGVVEIVQSDNVRKLAGKVVAKLIEKFEVTG